MAETQALEESAQTRNGKDYLIRQPVSDGQTALFFDALDANSSVEQASAVAGIHIRTGYRLLERYEAKLDGVSKFLAFKAFKAAENWVRASDVAADKGDHKPAKELLQTIGAVQVIGESNSSGVTIVIGTPDAPIAISQQKQTLSPTDK